MSVGTRRTDEPGLDGASFSRWRDTWVTGVRQATQVLLLVDLPRARVVAMSTQARELLQIRDDGTWTLDQLTDSARGTRPFELLALGVVETLLGRTRLRDQKVDVGDIWFSARGVRAPDGSGDLAILTLIPMHASDTTASSTPAHPRVLGDEPSTGEALAVITMDDGWLVTEVTTHRSAPGGGTPLVPIGVSAVELVVRDSRADLLRALALSTTGARAGVNLQVRLWGQRHPHDVSAAVTMQHSHDRTRFVLELYSLDEAGILARSAELERRLRRIAAEIRGIELMEPVGRQLQLESDPRLHGLSSRQLEIVCRLRQGERVPSIARSMFLAPSTVRNHLTTVFRRFGVNSQQELLEALRAKPL